MKGDVNAAKLEAPPPRPKATPTQLQAFKRRLVQVTREAGMSLRALERRAGYPTGALSKLSKGTLLLKREHLDVLAKALGVAGPETLIAETGLEWLLLSAPPPKPVGLSTVEAENDRLQQVIEQQGKLLEEMQNRERDAARASLALQADAEKQQAEVQRLRAELDTTTAAARDRGKRAEALKTALTIAEWKLAQHEARAAAAEKSLDEWRSYALDRQARVEQLEAFFREQAAQNKGAFVSHLIAFGLGAAVGSTKTCPPPRTSAASRSAERKSALARFSRQAPKLP
jgi:hypothetical protein